MKKEDKIYEMEKLAVEELNKKYNLNLKIWDLKTKDIYDDGTNLIAIYDKLSIREVEELYYVRAYFTNKKAYIFSCDRFIKEKTNE